MTDLLDLMETAAEQTPLAEPAVEIKPLTEADRLANCIQRFTAEREAKIESLKEATEKLRSKVAELNTIDGAVNRARDRQRMIAGSRGQYIDVKAEMAAAKLLGEEIDPHTLAKADEAAATMTAGELEDGIRTLNTRRAEIERSATFARGDVRRSMVEIHTLDALIAACRFEILRSEITREFLNLSAAQDLIRVYDPSATLTPLTWNDFNIPNALSNSALSAAWANPRFYGNAGSTASAIAGSGQIQAAAAVLKANVGVN